MTIVATLLGSSAAADVREVDTWTIDGSAPTDITSYSQAIYGIPGGTVGAFVAFATTASGSLYQLSGGSSTWTRDFDGAPGNVRFVTVAQSPIDGVGVDVFAITASGSLYHDYLYNGGWHGWEAGFNGAPNDATSVSVMRGPVNGTLDVFVTTARGTLYHDFFDGQSWHGFEANFDGAPGNVSFVTVGRGPLAASDVFVVTAAGTLYHDYFNSGGWHGWEANFNGAPGDVTSVAMSLGPVSGTLEAFATTAHGVLYHDFYDSQGWHSWAADFDGAPRNVTSVAMAQGPVGHAVEVFAITSGGILYHDYLDTGWHGWTASYAAAPGNIMAVAVQNAFPVTLDGALEIAVVKSNGVVAPGVPHQPGVLYRNFVRSRPSTPTQVQITGVTATSVTLTWNDASSLEAGYVVMVPPTPTTPNRTIVLPPNTTTATISSLAPSTQYCFDLYAFTNSANSDHAQSCGTTGGNTVSLGMFLNKIAPALGAIYYDGTSLARGIVTQIHVPSQSPVIELWFLKAGVSTSVCANAQPTSGVVVAPVNTNVNLTALFGASAVSVNGLRLFACARVPAGNIGASIPNVSVNLTYQPAP
jgi:hypothetical protein